MTSIGVCYFPEHWPRDRWETDVRGMAEAGIEYVRMGEFAWGVIEPERGAFEVEWLDEAVELVGDHGMQAVLCTPTATPPKWLVDERPEILPEAPDGTVQEFGSRRHYCFNSEVYREEARRITERLADHFADSPHVAGWQTDNEYGCHGTVRCYCDDCATAFRAWLADRYGDAETLNETWGNRFWSQQYPDLSAVDPPGPTPAEHHPSRLLDYSRFASDSVVAFNRIQTDILRAANDDWFVTHNFMGDFDIPDAGAVGQDLDFLAWDSYPTGFVQDRRPGEPTPDELRAGDPDEVGMNHDLYRGLLDRPFWVMEQQPGDVNWPPHAPQPGEGAMRLWAHHAVAHGADAVLYFRWRRCRQGQEQYHAGLRKRDGSADRGYREASEAAAELAEMDLAPVDAPVAVLHDYEDWWATSIQPHSPEFDYLDHLRAYYAAVRARGVQADLVHSESDLAGYDLVIAPNRYLVDDDDATALREYVEDGGHLLFGARTGQKTTGNQLTETPAPGPLARLAGTTVDRHESLPETIPTRVTFDGETYGFQTWAEWLDPDAASVRGEYVSGTAAGEPAVTHTTVGDGSVTYCGCWPGSDLADALVTDRLDAAGVAHTYRLPEGVRVAERDGLTWVTNFTSDPLAVDAPGDATFVVGDDRVEAFGVGVVDAPAASLSVEHAG